MKKERTSKYKTARTVTNKETLAFETAKSVILHNDKKN